jgi:hypothetical protein
MYFIYLPSPSAEDTAPHQIAEKYKKSLIVHQIKKKHGIISTSIPVCSIQFLFLPCSPEMEITKNKNT